MGEYVEDYEEKCGEEGGDKPDGSLVDDVLSGVCCGLLYGSWFVLVEVAGDFYDVLFEWYGECW